MDAYDVLIVGAGHGGAQAAIALRQCGFSGTIAIIGEEPDLPYERPALSKDYLSGIRSFERMLIRPAAFWDERAIDMLLGAKVVEVCPDPHTVRLGSGRTLGYGRLIWAAGASPRLLTCDGHDLAGGHAIRTRRDVDALVGELPGASRVVIVGGGYVGLEASAALVKAGKQVVLVETQNRVLARVAGSVLSRFFEDEHRSHGVDVRLGTRVERLEGKTRVSAVRLADGTSIPADVVIVGIGIEPAVASLLAAGAKGRDGVEVDEQCRTSLPDVFAVGDCASHVSEFAAGARIRLESIGNANDQAMVAAKTICGLPAAHGAVPWFWSNQFDIRLQTVGLLAGHDATITRGDPRSRQFSVAYLKDNRMVAIDCVNSTKDYVAGRRLIVDRHPLDIGKVADASQPLASLYADA